MANTVKGFFRTHKDAELAKGDIATLKKIPTLEIQVYEQAGFHPTTHTDMSTHGFFASLKHLLGIDPSSHTLGPEGVRRGGPVLDVKVDDSHVDAVADVLEQYGAEEISIFTSAEE